MPETTTPDPAGPAALRGLAQQLRVDAVRAVAAAGSGHPTSALSAADLMAVLLANHMRYDFDRPEHPGNDHLIFSKGHASPLLYAMYRAAGAVSEEELMTYRRLGSRLEGHPTPRLPWVDVATGSLGLGLPVGVGVALAGRALDALPYRVWVLTGDSELAEGSMWEAFARAGHARLGNLVAIVDVNRLGQSGETMLLTDDPVRQDSAAVLGRAVAVGHVLGAAAGLRETDRLREGLGERHRWHAVRGHLHELGGDLPAAAAAYAAAARRATNVAERDHLIRQAARARAAVAR